MFDDYSLDELHTELNNCDPNTDGVILFHIAKELLHRLWGKV